ncbi:hypothetical protein NTE_00327 [Candidatus Nitrososphaera evergladensis SR1]|uniref:Nitrososphaera output domain-containing protein n=2 Tax=Nitrososphaera TaxID=497726 RepID=A0A075MST4_9ARCH|nr:hypothetical protein NTE_00327 [Candidatus Nitrososphaera evergladensis SR1]
MEGGPMIHKLIADTENIADALLINLEATFGTRVFESISAKISEEYLGGEMDIRAAIIYRPDLFERAFIGMLGDIGERILANIWCSKLREQFELDSSVTYHKAGDLVKCIQTIRARANRRSSP